MACVALSHVSFTYPQQTNPVLNDLTFTVRAGEFVAICGATGSGKSTLLRLLKREIAPRGTLTGTIEVDGTPRDDLTEKEAAYRIGYVMQRPEQQIVTDKVWHEMAFGLENMGVPQAAIARRIAEMAAYFDMEDWFDKDVAALSGGQKQLLNLAAVMVMQPDILILDEPTAQLDPIAASAFIATVQKLNRETGLTVIMTEHRLEEIIPACDRLLLLSEGRIAAYDAPGKVVANFLSRDDLRCAFPAPARIFHALKGTGDCPLDVRGGRAFIGQYDFSRVRALPEEKEETERPLALEMKDVYFRYEKQGADILSDLHMQVRENEIYCVLGGNGSGKTTAMTVAAGLHKAYSGTVRVFGKKLKEYKNQSLYNECLTMLPQDVQTVFLCNTVREELQEAKAGESMLPFDFTPYYERHPYDLSGGEQQLVALAKVLAAKPRLLLMDEPTKGVDAAAKRKLVEILKELKQKGMTIVIVTHDVEFAALCADRCALFFRGNIISSGTPRAFFAQSSFYTTAVSRMTRGYIENAVTVEDVAALAQMNEKAVNSGAGH